MNFSQDLGLDFRVKKSISFCLYIIVSIFKSNICMSDIRSVNLWNYGGLLFINAKLWTIPVNGFQLQIKQTLLWAFAKLNTNIKAYLFQS